MFTGSVLDQHRRGHKTRTAAHIDNNAPRGSSLRISFAYRFRFLFLHGGRLCTGSEEHAEDVNVEESLEFTHGCVGDFSGGLDSDLSPHQRLIALSFLCMYICCFVDELAIVKLTSFLRPRNERTREKIANSHQHC